MATVPLVQRRTVISEWYTIIFLPEVFGGIRKTGKRRRMILHQDNTSFHTSRQTNENLSTQNIKLMGHLPYSPDLEPNSFFFLSAHQKQTSWTPSFVARRSR